MLPVIYRDYECRYGDQKILGCVFSARDVRVRLFCFLILLFSPLQNPIHPLTEPEQFQYAKRAKGIVIIYNLLLGIGLLMKANIFCDSIIHTVFIVGISVLAGKWKYRVSYIARLRRKL